MRASILLTVCLGVLFGSLAAAEPDLVTQGQVLLKNGEPEKALALFRKAAEADPKNLQAQIWIGETSLELDRPNDAITAGEKARELGGTVAGPYLLLAEAYALKAQHLASENAPGRDIRLHYADADRQAKKALEIDPKIKGAHLVCAKAALGDFQYDPAIEELKKEMAVDAKGTEAPWLLGNLLYNRKKDYAAAGKAFRAVVKRDPANVLGWKWLGASYEATKNMIEAAKAYLEASKLAPADTYATNRLYQASIDGQKPNWDYTRLIANFRTLVETLGGLKSARASGPARTLAYALIQARQHREALKTIATVLLAFPRDPNNHGRKADVLFAMNKRAEAIKALKIAVKLRPEGKTYYNALHKLGWASIRGRNLEEGLGILEWLFSVRKDADIANNLGFAHREGTRDYKKSLAWYLKASKLAPKNVDILNDTGLIYHYHMGEFDKAMPFYKKVLEIGRDVHAGELEMGKPPRGYADSLENMADIYVKRKQFKKANEMLDELLGYYPGRRVALDLKAKAQGR